MYTVLAIVLPIFALILVGYICRKTDRLGEKAASEINKMVVWLCLPALLFKVTATATWAELWQPGFIISFGAGTLFIFAATVVWRLVTGHSLVTSSIDGLSAGYANTGYIGIPLCAIIFGHQGLQPALISTLIVVCLLFAIAVVFIEIGLQTEKHLGKAFAVVVTALSKNPLVIAPIAGAVWAVTGRGLADPVVHFLDMLAAATTPCALVSLGLFLGRKTSAAKDTKANPWPLVTIKLVGQPLLTWVLAFKVFALTPLWANSAVLLSALPTGTGPFMLAEFYRREAGLISRTILVSTLGSLATLTALIIWMHFGQPPA
ncbi:AEC family transporter [Pseudomonas capeferrum]|uniref:AEC family transporter n=1 Tax=Pseudomonas capeferrum TaxID=1495066 RepID=UPI0015E3F6CE|nr:AEC family transporter [Pseudomonas capeferrum]MBA1200243.1 AEC family transporter [Pseudomonas capeferrum]